MQEEIVRVNKHGWDQIAPHFFGKTALPVYGPLIATEEELQLLGDVEGKRVLDIGCGSGHSLAYLASRGAAELWGVDLSSTQIEAAQGYLTGLGHLPHLFCAPMEEKIDLPTGYFDLVSSIYAIGWTTDLRQTLELMYSYLKPGGILIFSWDHPMYQCIGSNSQDETITVEKSYLDEGFELINKLGESVYVNRIKLSTYINELIKVGFQIQQLIEGDLAEEYQDQEITNSGRYYSLHKGSKVPSSFVIKAIKL